MPQRRTQRRSVFIQRRGQQNKKEQKGGFYPSVMGGVQNAILLMPAALRVGYSLLSRPSTRNRRRVQRRGTRRRRH